MNSEGWPSCSCGVVRVVAWTRGCVGAWLRGFVSYCRSPSSPCDLISVDVFAKCWDFPVLNVHPLHQNKECGSNSESISNTDLLF